MSEQLLRPKLENIISGHNINQDDADWLRAVLAQPVEGGAVVDFPTLQRMWGGYINRCSVNDPPDRRHAYITGVQHGYKLHTTQPVNQDQAHDMAGMLERGALAWAGVDPQSLRANAHEQAEPAAQEPTGNKFKHKNNSAEHAWRGYCYATLAQPAEYEGLAGEADNYSYFRDCLGVSYTPSAFGKHEGLHPQRVREAMEALKGQPWADVIASLVFDIELRRQREVRFASRIQELSQISSTPVSQAQQPAGCDGGTECPKQEPVAIELQGVCEVIKEGGGFWRPCSGCHELNEGQDTGPVSKVFGCALGNGCDECGGLGAIWDTTDYDGMAGYMLDADKQPAPVSAELPLLGESFEREQRYIVIKLSDLKSAGLDGGDLRALNYICQSVAHSREQAGKASLQCVVVESDWPEYETTWRAIEQRVTGAALSAQAANKVNV